MSREMTTRRGRNHQTSNLNDEIPRRRKSSMDRSTERPRERSTDSESSNSASTSKGNGIRTRLSTGSIHMNGTITIAVAKEIENNQKLSGTYKGNDFKESPTKTVSQTKKYQADSIETSHIISTPVVTPPLNTLGRKRGSSTPVEPAVLSGQVVPPKRRKIGRNDGSGEDNRNDYFCWLCHKEGTVVCCELCPRVYHSKCLELGSNLPQDWVCPECEKIMRAECIDTRSKAMSMITLDTLCTLLKYALERMKHQGCNPFEKPVDTASVAHYTDYIFNPMDLSQLERNIKKKMYGCTEAFLADAKWILHNCIIFNGTHHKLTSSAKMIIKICKHEMSEIELCPDCYLNSCIRKNDEWFSETCRTPHPLVWAKLKGYPFWPAKALREVDGQVDVRFFGAHDRSWVPTSAVFLLCKDIPTPIKKGRGGFENAMDELEKHIEKLSVKFGKYEFAPFRTPYDQRNVYSHVKLKSKTMKRLGRKQKLGTQKAKTEVKGQFGLNKLGGRILGQAERQSVVSKTAFAVKNKYMSVDLKQGDKTTATKTASALKNKYNSIITTRRGLMRSNSESLSSNNSSPVKRMVLVPLSSVDDKKIIDIKSVKESKSEKDENSSSVSTPTESTENKNSDMSKTKCIKIVKTDIVDKIKEKIDLMTGDENEIEEDDNLVTNINQSDSFDKDEVDNGRETTSDDKVTEKSVLQQTSFSKQSDIITVVHSSVMKESDAKIFKSTLENLELQNSELSSVKNEHDSNEEKITASDDSLSSPSKKEYLENLQKTIESCKSKLGIIGENEQIGDNVDDEVDDEEEEDEKMSDDENDNADDETDDDKKEVFVKNSKNDSDEMEKPELTLKETSEKDIAKDNTSNESEDKEKLKQINNQTEKSETEESNNRTKPPELNTKSDNIQKALSSLKKTLCSSDIKIPSIKNSTETGTDKLDFREKMDTESKTNLVEKSEGQKGSITEASEQSSSNDKSKSDIRTETVDEPGLMMEVESESDNERLMIDIEEERMKTCTPTKIRQNSSESKTSDKMSEDLDNERKLEMVDDDSANKANNKSVNVTTTEKRDDKMTDVVNMDVDGEKSPKERISADSTKCTNITTESLVKKLKSTEGKMIIHPSFMHRKKSISPPQTKKMDANLAGKKSAVTMSRPDGADIEGKKSTITSSRSEADTDYKRDLVDQFTKTLMSRIEGTFQDVCTEFVYTELQPKDNDETENLRAELDKLEWEQQQQLYELKHNFQLTISEMKACWEAEKQRLVAEVKSMCEKEKETVVAEAKKKQWCANCGKEAIFYCCWNTSYCDYPCQQSHWPQHMPNCMQSQQQNNDNTESGDKTKSPNEKTSDRVESSPISDQGSRPSSNRQLTPVGQTPQQVVISSPNVINNTQTPGNIHNTNMHQAVEKTRNPQNPLANFQVNDYRRQQPRDSLAAALQRQEEHRQIQYLHGSPAVQTSPDMSMSYMPIRPNIPPGNSPYRYGQGSPPEGHRNKSNNWTEEALNNACLAVTQGGVSVNKAAKVYRVPRQKLSERVSGKQQSQQPSSNTLSGQPIMHTNQGIANQPVRLQYVQPPQPAMSIPHAAQQYSSPVRMQAVQIQNQPMPGNMISQRPMMQQNNSMVYPLHLRQSHPGAMIPPGNQLVITQQGQRPPPPNVLPANVPYRY